jgi:hypothetical protein
VSDSPHGEMKQTYPWSYINGSVATIRGITMFATLISNAVHVRTSRASRVEFRLIVELLDTKINM